MDNKEILNQSYNDLAPLSNRWRKEFRLHKKTLDLVLERVPNLCDKRTLDIGCGIGVLVRAFSKLGAQAEGVDKHILVEWGNLDDVKKIWDEKNIRINVNDFFNAHYPESSFDIITSEDLFEHLMYSQKEFLDKVYKILRPGGCLFLATPNLVTILKRMRMLFGRSPHWDLDDFFLKKQPFGHVREFTKYELRRMAELSGFEVVDIKAHNVYFNKKWLSKQSKLAKAISYLLSSLFPNGRDVLFLIAKKLVH
ncbi:MAG: class I SAM-dependent methyltransferase [Patescibacteria group bacterium]|nr:class I SAM-dependent methyltransferase [Patescibacteria group bacterium]